VLERHLAREPEIGTIESRGFGGCTLLPGENLDLLAAEDRLLAPERHHVAIVAPFPATASGLRLNCTLSAA